MANIRGKDSLSYLKFRSVYSCLYGNSTQIMNDNTRISSVSYSHNCKPAFAHPVPVLATGRAALINHEVHLKQRPHVTEVQDKDPGILTPSTPPDLVNLSFMSFVALSDSNYYKNLC